MEEKNVTEKEAKKQAKIQEKEAKKKAKLEKKQEKKLEKNKENEVIANDIGEKALTKKMRKQNSDKIVILSIVLATILIAGGLFVWYFYTANLEAVVTFEGGKITKEEYKLYYDRYSNILLQYYGYPISEVPKALAEKAALDKILLIQANDAGVVASDEDIAEIERQFADQEVIDMFNEQKIDIGKMKQMYLNDMKIYAYIKKLAEEANDDEVLAYLKEVLGEDADFHEYDTSHILFKTVDDNNVSVDDAKKAEIKQKAEGVLARVLAGEDFATLAKEFSEDISKDDGGKFVFYDNGQTVEAYETAAKTLQDGQVYASLVESEYGFHIIKMNKKTENGRVKSVMEREYFIQNNLNKKAEEKNVYINTDRAIKVVENLSGQKISVEEDKKTEDTNK